MRTDEDCARAGRSHEGLGAREHSWYIIAKLDVFLCGQGG